MARFQTAPWRGAAWFAAGLVVGVAMLGRQPTVHAVADAQALAQDELRAELTRVSTLLPDQSHAMKDVADHFSNLWFALEAENWPLASFYLGETRNHLKWAVGLKPVRQVAAGNLELKPILEAVDSSLLAPLKEAVDAQDPARARDLYRQSLEGCYTCHKSSEKPYLRPQVPAMTTQPIINTDPKAAWPM